MVAPSTQTYQLLPPPPSTAGACHVTFVVIILPLRGRDDLYAVAGRNYKLLSYGRDLASSAILRGWVNFRLNFRLKGYVSRQYLWTVR